MRNTKTINMNREIKFRVWDAERQEWLSTSDSYLVFKFTQANSTINIGGASWVYQQFTGLKDKNGKEIYEGDILDIPYGNGKFQVVWGWVGFCAKKIPKHIGSLGSLYYEYMAGMENIYDQNTKKRLDVINHVQVIGNIFETPELLT